MPLPARVADLASYDLVLSVADLGSMGRAASAHGVSQAAVSARVRALERALGFTLFERSPQGTRLTVVESGFNAIPAHRRDEAFRMNQAGWEGQIANIAAHLGG